MTPNGGGPSAQEQRRARLAQSLRENLKRRKAQQRSRAAEADQAADKPPRAAEDDGSGR